MPIRYAFFDVADTLLCKPDLFPRICRVLDEHGQHAEESSLRAAHYAVREATRFPDHTDQDFYRAFNRRFLEQAGIACSETLALDVFEACRGLPWHAFGDVAALASVPVPLGILSNWDRSLETKIDALLPYSFVTTVGSAQDGVAKPDPAAFLLAAERAQVSFQELLFVGDSIVLDVRPARDLGLRAVLIDRFGVAPEWDGERVGSLHELIAHVWPNGD